MYVCSTRFFSSNLSRPPPHPTSFRRENSTVTSTELQPPPPIPYVQPDTTPSFIQYAGWANTQGAPARPVPSSSARFARSPFQVVSYGIVAGLLVCDGADGCGGGGGVAAAASEDFRLAQRAPVMVCSVEPLVDALQERRHASRNALLAAARHGTAEGA